LETVGSEEALADVTEVFLQDTARTLSALRADVRDGRAAEVRRNAHALKSTAASFGASHLSDLCRRLEDLGRSEHLEDAAPIVDAVAAEFATVRKALEDLRR
jgi:HPt (histidine-containing phosphotransfer) domain-containing protein